MQSLAIAIALLSVSLALCSAGCLSVTTILICLQVRARRRLTKVPALSSSQPPSRSHESFHKERLAHCNDVEDRERHLLTLQLTAMDHWNPKTKKREDFRLVEQGAEADGEEVMGLSDKFLDL